MWNEMMEQFLIFVINFIDFFLVFEFFKVGVDFNVVMMEFYKQMGCLWVMVVNGEFVFDFVNIYFICFKEFFDKKKDVFKVLEFCEDFDSWFDQYEKLLYQYVIVFVEIVKLKVVYKDQMRQYEKEFVLIEEFEGMVEKRMVVL